MSYFIRRKGARPINDRLSGLGATSSSWGEQASLDPNLSQPTPPPPSTPPKKDSGWASELAKILGALAISKAAPSQPTAQPYVVQQGGGMSTTTMLVGGGLALTALVLLLKD